MVLGWMADQTDEWHYMILEALAQIIGHNKA